MPTSHMHTRYITDALDADATGSTSISSWSLKRGSRAAPFRGRTNQAARAEGVRILCGGAAELHDAPAHCQPAQVSYPPQTPYQAGLSLSRHPIVSCQLVERALPGRLPGVPGRLLGVPGRLPGVAGMPGDGADALGAKRLGGLPLDCGMI